MLNVIAFMDSHECKESRESVPSGNLHLSAAVYLSGASFIQIEKVNYVQM